MSTWLLTGGAGYIGSHVADRMRAAGVSVVILDDLSTGVRMRLDPAVPLVEGDVGDSQLVTEVLQDFGCDGVIHLAAKKAVAESVQQPLDYYASNVTALTELYKACAESTVRSVVFSSSAAVYGQPDLAGPITESDPTVPESPYGHTKLAGEWLTAAFSRAQQLQGKRLDAVLLRYFNVAGAGQEHLADTSVANLIPLVFRAIDAGEPARIFGNNYPTPDGTCVRDYIHVDDLADAHVRAVIECDEHGDGSYQATFNVGTGVGSSVSEVLATVSEVVGHEVPAIVTDRRPGDPASLVASAGLIRQELGWSARHGLREMVESAWQGWRSLDAQ